MSVKKHKMATETFKITTKDMQNYDKVSGECLFLSVISQVSEWWGPF